MGTVRDDRDDAELLAAAARGERAAFATFYRRHLAAVVGALLRETGDRELAADLAAEVFATVLLHAGRYRPEGSTAQPWLYGIARNKARESRRRRRAADKARRRLGIAAELITEDDLERVDELASRGGELLALVERLPTAQRDALRARVIDERDYGEIAAASGATEAAVRQRVSRALAWLRTQTTTEEQR
jgi:RNA polymerase sigma-70 factor (ECF subfamily)